MKNQALLRLVTIFIIFAWLAAPFQPAGAKSLRAPDATWTVTKTADTNDGSCAVDDCSLREAIAAASDGDTINFALLSYPATITLTLGELSVGASLLIQGPGRDDLAVTGASATRLFNVSTGNVSISNMTLTAGKVSHASAALGGCVLVAGSSTLTLTDVTVENCTAQGSAAGAAAAGGGIYNLGTVSLLRTILRGNAAIGGDGGNATGGGINNQATATLSHCLVVENQALGGDSTAAAGGNGSGGGAFNTGASFTFENTTFSANLAVGGSGATANGVGRGGGLYENQQGSHVDLVTFALNTASDEGGGFYSNGSSGNAPDIASSLLAWNNAPSGPDLAGIFTSGDYNLIRNTDGATIEGTTTHNLSALDPLLAPLAQNGSSLLTHALLPGSPALNAIPFGTNDCGGSTYTDDQRGAPRPQGQAPAACDIGAYELRLVTSTADDAGSGTLRTVIDAAAAGETIAFDLPTYPATITLTTGELLISNTLTVLGPGVDQLTIDGDSAGRVVKVNALVTVKMTDLTIANGQASGSPAQGGCVYNAGDLTLEGVAVVGCLSQGDAGGDTGGAASGGGIYNLDTLALTDCTLKDNVANGGDGVSTGGIGAGGGLFAADASQISASGCTFDSNSVNGGTGTAGGNAQGGGFYQESSGAFSFLNTTFYSNYALGGAGGTSGLGMGGAVNAATGTVCDHCTIYANFTGDQGGGIYSQNADRAGPALRSSVVAGNSASDGADLYVDGDEGILSQDYNLIGEVPGGTNWFWGITAHNTLNTDPQLGDLADNGGPTQTALPGAASPLLEAGDPNDQVLFDQRGVPRPQGAAADIGAVEVRLGTGPGGVGETEPSSSLKLWLKAGDIGGKNDGDPVSTWADASGNGFDASQDNVSNQPAYRTGVVNYQPVVRFTAAGSQYLASSDAHVLDLAPIGTVFNVAKYNGSAQAALGKYYGVDNLWSFGYALHSPACAASIEFATADGSVCNNYPSGFSLQAVNKSGGTAGLYLNGAFRAGGAVDANTPITAPLTIGRSENTLYLDGDLAEAVIYNTTLVTVQQTLVDNYLAAKYGLSISDDKYDGDYPEEGNYDWDVAGIGQEAGSSQVVAHSAGLVLSAAGGLADGDYLLAGHKTLVNTEVISGVLVGTRWGRVWYLDKTGALDVYLDFNYPESGLDGIPVPGDTYVLLYSTYGAESAFNFTPLLTTTTTSGSRVRFTVTDADLQTGYYTLQHIPSDKPAGYGSTLGLWLRADAGVSESGAAVSAWADQSGSGNDAVQGTAGKRPLYVAAEAAFNDLPVVRFDGSDDNLQNGSLQTGPQISQFAVAATGSASADKMIIMQPGYFFMGETTGHDFISFYGNGTAIGPLTGHGYLLAEGVPDLLASLGNAIDQPYGGGLALAARASQMGASTGGYLVGGRNLQYWDGDIAEVLVYSTTLNTPNRLHVENYLASKYALLFNGSSEGCCFGTVHLKREAAGALGSLQTGGLAILDANGLPYNGDSLEASYTITTNNNITTGLPAGGDWSAGNGQRWDRQWHLEKVQGQQLHGGLVRIVFDFSDAQMDNGGAHPKLPASNYRLLKRSVEGVGHFTEIARGEAISGERISFLVDASLLGSYFTLGTVDKTTSPTVVQVSELAARPLPGPALVLAGMLLIGAALALVRRRQQ